MRPFLIITELIIWPHLRTSNKSEKSPMAAIMKKINPLHLFTAESAACV